MEEYLHIYSKALSRFMKMILKEKHLLCIWLGYGSGVIAYKKEWELLKKAHIQSYKNKLCAFPMNQNAENISDIYIL